MTLGELAAQTTVTTVSNLSHWDGVSADIVGHRRAQKV